MPFKRIFFGLLILSVLTSEGAAFFNKVTIPFRGSFADSCEIGDFSVCPQNEDESINPVKSGSYRFFALEEILRSQSPDNSSFSVFEGAMRIDCGNYRVKPAFAKAEAYSFNMVLHGSDISPPALS